MTNDSWPDRPQVETTRVGGGSSARIAVVVALVVLGGVVWIGISGRHDPPPEVASLPSSAPPATLARPTPSTASTPALDPTLQPTTGPIRQPTPTPERFSTPITFGEDAFAVIAFFDGRMYLEVLHEDEPGHLTGKFRLPFPAHRRGQTIELAQLWTRDESRLNYVSIGKWAVRVDPLGPNAAPDGPVLDKSAAAQPDLPRIPRAVSLGYELVINVETRGDYGVVLVDVRFGR